MAPRVVGLPPHEQADWLPVGDDLPSWLRELGDLHRAAVVEHEDAVMAVVVAEAEKKDAARLWRRQLREALAVGEPAPERDFDPEAQQAQIEIAQEDSLAARDTLARTVVAILAELRSRRDELRPYFDQFPPALSESLARGPSGVIVFAREILRDQLKYLDEPDVVDLSDPTQRQFAGDDQPEAAYAE
jgi:hypothetical protein